MTVRDRFFFFFKSDMALAQFRLLSINVYGGKTLNL